MTLARMARDLVLVGTAVLFCTRATRAQELKIVTHPSVAVSSATAEEISAIFLRVVPNWPGGQAAAPVDQKDGSELRNQFCMAVHGLQPKELKAFWLHRVFSGKAVPPPTKSSDEEVIAYVASTPGAVGYVSADADIGARVKVLKLTN